MKMFNLINIGERAGSGVPNIFNVWEDEGWEEPEIIEKFEPDRTILALSFVKKASQKVSDKVSDKMNDKERIFYISLLKIFDDTEVVTTKVVGDFTKMPKSTVRRYLNKFIKMNIIRSEGKNKGTKYYLTADHDKDL